MIALKQLEIPTLKGRKIIPSEKIIRIQASSNYCKIFILNEYPLTVSKILGWFETELSPESFYRINRGDLINKSYIIKSESKASLKLSTGEIFQISRRRRSKLKPIFI